MYNNCKFSNKSLAYFGLGLGGHIKLLQLQHLLLFLELEHEIPY